MHPTSQKLLEKLLHLLAEQGEKKALSYAKKVIRQERNAFLKESLAKNFMRN